MRIIKKLLPLMLDSGGHIVTIGSIGCFFPSPFISAYTSSKFALYA